MAKSRHHPTPQPSSDDEVESEEDPPYKRPKPRPKKQVTTRDGRSLSGRRSPTSHPGPIADPAGVGMDIDGDVDEIDEIDDLDAQEPQVEGRGTSNHLCLAF